MFSLAEAQFASSLTGLDKWLERVKNSINNNSINNNLSGDKPVNIVYETASDHAPNGQDIHL
eukprot:SAG31_NODE_2688_length_5250_cov_11.245583_2_plen_62_part_00